MEFQDSAANKEGFPSRSKVEAHIGQGPDTRLSGGINKTWLEAKHCQLVDKLTHLFLFYFKLLILLLYHLFYKSPNCWVM
jgi:hypothetical protein